MSHATVTRPTFVSDPGSGRRQHWPIEPPRPEWPLSAFGETKTMREWSKDPRCQVKYDTLVDRVARAGWPPEKAIGSTLRHQCCSEEAKRARFRELIVLILDGLSMTAAARAIGIHYASAFELCRKYPELWDSEMEAVLEEDPVPTESEIRERCQEVQAEWDQDTEKQRCGVDPWEVTCLGFRDGQPGRKCGLPGHNRRRHQEGVVREGRPMKWLLTAWGETKSMYEWAQDERCLVCYETLKFRVKYGWSAQRAVGSPAAGPGASRVMLTAFGETKRQEAWLRDPRCQVKSSGLRSRIKRGWPIEDAISKPPMGPQSPGPNHPWRRLDNELFAGRRPA